MNRHVGAGVAQRILIALELGLKRVVSEPLIARKGPQLCLGTPGTRAEELHEKLKDAHVGVDGGTHPPTLRETRASEACGAPSGLR